MSCASIQRCECIERISGILSHYQRYQHILHPQDIDNDNPTSTTESVTCTESHKYTENNDTESVEFVAEMDHYNHELMDYNQFDENIDPNSEENIVTYLDELDMTQILNDYNHITLHHYSADFESIYNLITTQYSYFVCDINECNAFLRNNRSRETEYVLSEKTLHLQNEYSRQNLVSIDLLDSIHCHLLHLFDIGYKISANELFYSDKSDEKSQQINIDKLYQISLQKQKRLIQIRGTERIRNNKFKTYTNNIPILNERKLYKAISIGMDEEEIDLKKSEDLSENSDSDTDEMDMKAIQIETNDTEDKVEQNRHTFGSETPDSVSISPKYTDLKIEILNNKFYKIDIGIYAQIMLKASQKLSIDISRSLTSDEYGPLLAENVIVLLLFLDCDSFRNTYVNVLKCNMNDLSELYNFHFGVENTINLYGINISDNDKYNNLYRTKIFYHSCSDQIIFEGIKCEFLNIKSMSANIAPVALYNMSDENDGILLEFGPFDLNCKYFMCAWLSSFGGEDESVFLDKTHKSGLELQNITFLNELNDGSNLRCFLQALSCFDGSLCEGWKSTNTTNEHYQIIAGLIAQKKELSKDGSDDCNGLYKQQIFDAFCAKKLRIEILVQNLRGPFCKLLFKSENNTSYMSASAQLIRFDVLCELFVNCTSILTWYVANPDYNQHSGINEQFLGELYAMLEAMNANISENESKLNKIIINNNHQRIEPILSKHRIEALFEERFFEKGWKIEHLNYSDKMDQIIVTKIMLWKRIKINSFRVTTADYYIKTETLDTYITLKYGKFREMFEEINKKLASSHAKDVKQFKKIFPKQSFLKKNNNQKLMKQRQSKLNQYFEKLILFANAQKNDHIKMTIMTTLTCFLIK